MAMTEITEDAKAKAAYQFRTAAVAILDDAYPMYGYKQQNPDVAIQMLELALLFAKRMRGQDVPIDHKLAAEKLRQR